MKPLADLLSGAPLPDGDGAKTERGAVVVIGGPPSCPGAVLLAGNAALRSGAGRVQLVVHPDVALAVGTAVPEALVLGWDLERPMPPVVADRLADADAVVIGPGCRSGLDQAVGEVVSTIGPVPLVLDAGALDQADAARAAEVVVAPNPFEAAELLGGAPGADRSDEPGLAAALAARLGGPVAVRGERCAVADPAGACWTMDRTPPGLGTPGSGDVFVGVLAALLAQGVKALRALGWAVTLHAAAGGRLAVTTPTGYLARDLLGELPVAFAAHRGATSDGGGEAG